MKTYTSHGPGGRCISPIMEPESMTEEQYEASQPNIMTNEPTETPADIVREIIQAPHEFTDPERLVLSDRLIEAMRNQDQIDAELDSVKQEFKARIEKARLETNVIRRKLGDGFEMRPTPSIVRFNEPCPGRKSYLREDTGELIRDETMSAADFSRPLFKDQNGKDATEPAEGIVDRDEEGNIIPDGANVSSPGAEDAGSTPLGEAIDRAAAATDQPPIRWDPEEPLEQAGWTVGGLVAKFRFCARKAKWTHVATSMFSDELLLIGDVERIKETIRPHLAK